jgi:hypothetical protein
MRYTRWSFLIVVARLALTASPAQAHVPYVEWRDYSLSQPLRVANIEQSIAAYAWLEVEKGTSDDIDVYRFVVGEVPVEFYAEVLVPVCGAYAGFEPWFALVGPDLPEPGDELPFELPPGYGALVVGREELPSPRPTFYEPFGAKRYYQGLTLEEPLTSPGTYYVLYWDPRGRGGDYVAVLGRTEQFRFRDIVRAFYWTPKIRRDEELHVECSVP